MGDHQTNDDEKLSIHLLQVNLVSALGIFGPQVNFCVRSVGCTPTFHRHSIGQSLGPRIAFATVKV